MSARFIGKTAIVTGASRGIGFAVAEQLVAGGAKVVVTARTKEALDRAVEQLGGAEHAVGIAGKAHDREHQAETVRQAIETFGGVDFLVNNAGVNPNYGPAMEVDIGAARKTVEINCLAALAWVQRAYWAWMKDHGGAIVNVSSLSSVRAAPGIGFYGATKAMLNSLTELLAVELGPRIRVNGVAPAVVKTKFAAALYAGREDEVAAAYPLKRLGVPPDVGGVVAFLLSDDASWVTGQTIVIDGGVSLAAGEK